MNHKSPLMKPTILFCLLATCCTTTAQKVNPIAVKSAALYDKAIVQIKPAYKNYVTQTAKAFSNRKLNVDSLKNTMKAPGNAMFGMLNNADIEMLMFLVLQASAKETEADLRDMMAAMEKNKQKKEALRKEEEQIQDAAKAATYSDVTNMVGKMQNTRQTKDSLHKGVQRMNAAQDKPATNTNTKTPLYTADQLKRLAAIKKEKDALDEMNQQDQLQLQQMMDKKSQLESMISNVMKAQSDSINNISSALKAS